MPCALFYPFDWRNRYIFIRLSESLMSKEAHAQRCICNHGILSSFFKGSLVHFPLTSSDAYWPMICLLFFLINHTKADIISNHLSLTLQSFAPDPDSLVWISALPLIIWVTLNNALSLSLFVFLSDPYLENSRLDHFRSPVLGGSKLKTPLSVWFQCGGSTYCA